MQANFSEVLLHVKTFLPGFLVADRCSGTRERRESFSDTQVCGYVCENDRRFFSTIRQSTTRPSHPYFSVASRVYAIQIQCCDRGHAFGKLSSEGNGSLGCFDSKCSLKFL